MRPKARRRGMSRGRGLPVTVSTAKRTFETQKSACVMDSGVGSHQDRSKLMNIGRFDTLMRQRHRLWRREGLQG